MLWNDKERPIEIVDLAARNVALDLAAADWIARGSIDGGPWSEEEPESLILEHELQVPRRQRVELLAALANGGGAPATGAGGAAEAFRWRPGSIIAGTDLVCREVRVEMTALSTEESAAKVVATFRRRPLRRPEPLWLRLPATVSGWNDATPYWLDLRKPEAWASGRKRPWRVVGFDKEGMAEAEPTLRSLALTPTSLRPDQAGIYCRRQAGDEVMVEVADLEAPLALGGCSIASRLSTTRRWTS